MPFTRGLCLLESRRCWDAKHAKDKLCSSPLHVRCFGMLQPFTQRNAHDRKQTCKQKVAGVNGQTALGDADGDVLANSSRYLIMKGAEITERLDDQPTPFRFSSSPTD